MKVHKYAWGVEYTDEQLAKELISAAGQVDSAMSSGFAWLVKRAGERMLELLSSDEKTFKYLTLLDEYKQSHAITAVDALALARFVEWLDSKSSKESKNNS
jgi:hypothetical protein